MIRWMKSCAAALALLSASTPASAQTLEGFAGTTRPLFVFADRADDPQLLEQRRLLAAQRDGLRERDVPVIEVVDETVRIDGQPSDLRGGEVRAIYDVRRPGFRVQLYGKDRGLKLEERRPVTPEEVFALIDSMPMRRREMREQNTQMN